MRCGISPDTIPVGNGCKSPGTFVGGCIYEIAWASLALADAGTDATLKHVPRSGVQLVLGFIVDIIQPVQAATGPGVGPLEGQGAYMSAVTVNGDSYMPKHSSSSGVAVTSNKYPLAAFGRAVMQRAGGVLASLDRGEGTPWAQFGIHRIPLGINDDVTVTIENETGLAADFGGTFIVYQFPNAAAEQISTGSPLGGNSMANLGMGQGSSAPVP